MILNILQEGVNDVFKAEVAFFGARSLLDGIEDETDAHILAFYAKLIEFFLSNRAARESFIVAKSVILFINQSPKIFNSFQDQTA